MAISNTVNFTRENETILTTLQPASVNTPDSISALKLADLNLELFSSLCALGTPRERICHALQLDEQEFEYVRSMVRTNALL
jgi:hypothetical protein